MPSALNHVLAFERRRVAMPTVFNPIAVATMRIIGSRIRALRSWPILAMTPMFAAVPQFCIGQDDPYTHGTTGELGYPELYCDDVPLGGRLSTNCDSITRGCVEPSCAAPGSGYQYPAPQYNHQTPPSFPHPVAPNAQYMPPRQHNCLPPCRHNCQPPCQPGCTCNTPTQPRSLPEQPRAVPRSAPAPQTSYRETGFYQAGPRTGGVEGASNSLGIRTGAISLPRLRLEMPTFELPSLFRTSLGARMHVSDSEAPWVSTGVQATRAETASYSASRSADVPAAPRSSAEPETPKDQSKSRALDGEECADVKREYEAKIQELKKKIEKCDQLRKCIEDSLRENPLTMHQGAQPQRLPSSPTARVVSAEQPREMPPPATKYDAFPAAVPPENAPRQNPQTTGPADRLENAYPLPSVVLPASHLGSPRPIEYSTLQDISER